MYNSIYKVELEIKNTCKLYEENKISNKERMEKLSYLTTCRDFLKHIPKKELENTKVKTR